MTLGLTGRCSHRRQGWLTILRCWLLLGLRLLRLALLRLMSRTAKGSADTNGHSGLRGAYRGSNAE